MILPSSALSSVDFTSRTCLPGHNCTSHCWGVGDWEEPTFCSPYSPSFGSHPSDWGFISFLMTTILTGIFLLALGYGYWKNARHTPQDGPRITYPFDVRI